MKALPVRVRRRVVPALACAVIATGVAVVASVAPASAHHADIVASVVCAEDGSYVVSYTATAWSGPTNESRTNPDVIISAALNGGAPTQVGSGAFNLANGFQFTGQFSAPASTTTVQVIVLANGEWGNGFDGGQQAMTDVLTPPECVVPTTTTTSTTTTTTTTSTTTTTTTTAPPADEGCTPGFWKNHPEDWQGYSTGQTLGSVFSVPASLGLGDNTLLQALGFGGGSTLREAAQILLRAATAALLNASHGDVDYVQDASSIISSVNSALASGSRSTILNLATTLDIQNNAGCPL
jgi:hypothetical protein